MISNIFLRRLSSIFLPTIITTGLFSAWAWSSLPEGGPGLGFLPALFLGFFPALIGGPIFFNFIFSGILNAQLPTPIFRRHLVLVWVSAFSILAIVLGGTRLRLNDYYRQENAKKDLLQTAAAVSQAATRVSDCAPIAFRSGKENRYHETNVIWRTCIKDTLKSESDLPECQRQAQELVGQSNEDPAIIYEVYCQQPLAELLADPGLCNSHDCLERLFGESINLYDICISYARRVQPADCFLQYLADGTVYTQQQKMEVTERTKMLVCNTLKKYKLDPIQTMQFRKACLPPQ